MRVQLFGSVTAGAVLGVASMVGAAVITPGNLVVLRQGDGVNAIGANSSALSLMEFTGVASTPSVQTVNLPSSGAGRLTLTNQGLEGHVTLNDGHLAFGGYDYDANQAVTGTTSVLRRVVGFDIAQDLALGPQMSATTTQYQGGDIGAGTGTIRATVVSGNGFYTAGSGQSTYLLPNGANASAGTEIMNDASVAAQRAIGIYGGNLYLTTGTAPRGVVGFTGTPTSPVAAPPRVIPTTLSHAQDFWFSPDFSTAYVAAEVGGFGIMKFGQNQSGGYDHLYNISTDYDGAGPAPGNGFYMAVDDSGIDPVLYSVSVDGSTLLQVTDLGDAATSAGTLQVLQTAGENYRFRGLVVTPVPEPTGLALLALGSGLLLGRRRRA